MSDESTVFQFAVWFIEIFFSKKIFPQWSFFQAFLSKEKPLAGFQF